jgi:ATP-dependent 26S proteasome regulatory subunit
MNVFQESLGEDVLRMSTDEIVSRTRLLDNEIKIMKSELMRISHELQAQNEKIKENTEKIKVNKTLPYLVSNVIEVFIKYFYMTMWIQDLCDATMQLLVVFSVYTFSVFEVCLENR